MKKTSYLIEKEVYPNNIQSNEQAFFSRNWLKGDSNTLFESMAIS